MKKLIVVTALLMLIAAAGFAQGNKGSQSTTSAKMEVQTPDLKQATGVISSIGATKLVLKHKVNKKDVETTFVLNADTKKEGDPVVGASVTVHYKVVKMDNIATLLQVQTKK